MVTSEDDDAAASKLLYSEWERPCGSGVALVTTLLVPSGGAEVVRSFVRWHLAIGFERIYLYFDDDNVDDEPVGWAEASREAVERFRRGDATATVGKFSEFVDSEVQARQVVNAKHASDLARARGLRWLVHLDVDEALYASSRQAFLAHFADLDRRGVGHRTYANHEGVAPLLHDEDDANRDYFRRVTLFRKNHLCVPFSSRAVEAMAYWKRRTRKGQYLLCYDNGKSAVRLVDGIAPTSVHGWTGGSLNRETALVDPARSALNTLTSVSEEEPCVLHFVVCGLFWLRTKYDILGAFPDAWFGGSLPIAPSFHLDARDVVATGDAKKVRAFYESHVARPADASLLQHHVDAGVCRHYSRISHFLAHFDSSEAASSSAEQPNNDQTGDDDARTRTTQEGWHVPLPQPPPREGKPPDDALRAWILSSAAQSFL